MPTLESQFSTGSLNAPPCRLLAFASSGLLERPWLAAGCTVTVGYITCAPKWNGFRRPSAFTRVRPRTVPDREVHSTAQIRKRRHRRTRTSIAFVFKVTLACKRSANSGRIRRPARNGCPFRSCTKGRHRVCTGPDAKRNDRPSLPRPLYTATGKTNTVPSLRPGDTLRCPRHKS
jgi:hypothetical protein